MNPCPSHYKDVSQFDFQIDHEDLYFRRTKIVATIGPASSSTKILTKLMEKGLNVARINFSHGDPDEHVRIIAKIRRIARATGHSVAILADLCGPKIRVGKFTGDAVMLKEHSIVTITVKPVLGTATIFQSQYKNLVKEIAVGHPILLDDGNLELKVTKKLSDAIEAKVIRGGVLKNNKGMNLPNTKLAISALTAKDKSDVLYCIKADVDYIALSFVRHAKDITELRTFLKRHKADIPIVAKIEKPEALANIAAILDTADAIMIARGDLGVELPPRKVPIIQNKLIKLANNANKPVIVATQMLESMIEHSRPTRAEVTDVSAACLAGADAVMLSAETASGRYPVETLDIMDSILRETEGYQFFALKGQFGGDVHTCKDDSVEDAIGCATAQLSRDLMVRAIFVLTRTGESAQMISSDRPAAPIIALTQSDKIAHRLNLYWGIQPRVIHKDLTLSEYLQHGEEIIKKIKLAKKGDYLLMISGLGGKNLKTNSIVVHQVG
jgi:pyruvate kinase